MTKEEIQKNSEHWYNKYKELERENRLLGERCNQLLKDKGDLTDKIADIKANCDLAIEGRDVKIIELEADNKLLEQRGSDILKELLDKNKRCKELERQIEKMKCCDNCCHCGTNYDCDYCSDHFEEMPDWQLKE